MCPDSNQGALSAQVLVQLVLQVNEAAVSGTVKVDASQNSSYSKGSDQSCLCFDD